MPTRKVTAAQRRLTPFADSSFRGGQQEPFSQEQVEKFVDLTLELGSGDVELLQHLLAGLGSAAPFHDQLPKACAGPVEGVDAVAFELHDHDLVIDAARDHLRMGSQHPRGVGCPGVAHDWWNVRTSAHIAPHCSRAAITDGTDPAPPVTDASSFLEPDAYSVADYGVMIADRVRMNAYTNALRRTVKPGSFVVEIGTGAGIFALLACKLGARRVVAIEPDDAIDLARELAMVNGCADRIDFIQGASMDVNLPEPADVIISDLRGALPLYRRHIPSLVDARTRLLAPDGWLIPWRDTVWGALVHEPKSYRRYVDVWRNAVRDLDTEAARALVTNTWWKKQLSRSQLLVEPQVWAVLDYHTIEDTNVVGQLDWTIARTGTSHGLGMWFDAELAESVSFSGAPGKPKLIYGHAFFPFAEPLALNPGDRVAVTVHGSLVGDDYQWRWETRMWTGGDPGRVAASFDQSTIHGGLLSPARLRRTMATHAPTLSDEGRVMHFALGQMAQGVTLNTVADELVAKFPKRFASWDDGFAYASRLSVKYSV
jgi:protein arginine N-methyltransferase 1